MPDLKALSPAATALRRLTGIRRARQVGTAARLH
jgi:hypothetical protein